MTDSSPVPAASGVAWRWLYAETEQRLSAAGLEQAASDARRIVEEIVGDARPWPLLLDELATVRGVAQLDRMVERRLAGEPIQYVLGSWGFRTLDLFVDDRVLIPRPETEEVVGAALTALAGLEIAEPTVVDLGTGSGAIALAVATEVRTAHVWATDRSDDALAVASANLAGSGRVGARVRLAEGDWYHALPGELRGSIDLIVANPPYIGAGEVLSEAVSRWEPRQALIGGPQGDEQLIHVIEGAPRWLSRPGVLVVEMAPAQVRPMSQLAQDSGFAGVHVVSDIAGHQRAIVAHAN